jgi:adenylylsulfate kinase
MLSGWVVWIVGLPGSGKSSLARAALLALNGQGEILTHLQMDDRRKVYFPHPRYSHEERIKAYELFAQEAGLLAFQGQNVLMDATAPRVAMREMARVLIPRFAEIYLHCPLEIAMQREASRPEGKVIADMYQKALERKRTGKVFPGLGEVIGVDTPFEQNPAAECIIDAAGLNIEQGSKQLIDFINYWK